jgi:hypothetical protein
MTSLHKPLSQSYPNFTGMFLWWSPLKIVQDFVQTFLCLLLEKVKSRALFPPGGGSC